MNTKFLIVISFLVAVLGHLLIFNFVTFVLPVAPAAFKPKFFFLGPILQQDDVYQEPLNDFSGKSGPASPNYFSHDRTELKNVLYEMPSAQQDPFTIEILQKPLTAQAAKGQEKVVIKSTFELTTEKPAELDPRAKIPDHELNIQPYRPLRAQFP